MAKAILVGKTSAGKTTLVQALLGHNLLESKTQSTCFEEGFIDIPGEYLENPRFYNAIITMAFDSDLVLLVYDVNSEGAYFPPGFGDSFNIDVVGVITKMDELNDEAALEAAKQVLLDAGASSVYAVSSVTGEGIETLRKLLDV